MVAMMLPSAAPAILLYARVREQRERERPIVQPWMFLAGYLAVWLLFSIVAAASQRLDRRRRCSLARSGARPAAC